MLNTITADGASSSHAQAISQDEDQQRTAAVSDYKLPFAPLSFVGTPIEWANSTQLTQASFSGIVQNGQTLATTHPVPYHNKFAWLAGATYKGGVVHEGQLLQKWEFEIPGNSFVLLVTNVSVPVVQTIIMNTTVLTNITTTFTTFTSGAELPGVWTNFNATDFSHPQPCPAPHGTPAAPVVRPVFIFHPNSSFDIVQQDLGDERGDVLFVCTDLLTRNASSTHPAMDHGYQWITRYDLEHTPRWGQYQNCNGYPPLCLGAEDFWVGHQAAYALGLPAAGQCGNNTPVGEWFSLPKGGQCAHGVKPDGSTCTWTTTRVKTVDSACIFHKQAFLDACQSDGRAPFAKATALFQAAFASDDPAEGGCPPLPGPAPWRRDPTGEGGGVLGSHGEV